jgi:ubiquinone/menaquinone biosynthesis C-methylase UbiE
MFTSLLLKMLNKEASSYKNRPREIINTLQILEGYAIADIGSGGGYFTLEFARIVGTTGRVYAVDNKPENMEFINRQSEQQNLDNVTFALSIGNDINLPEAGIDLIFLRNAFHHLPEPAEYFNNLKRFLKPSGKVVVIEHKPKGGFSFVAMFKHYTPGEFILREMENAGYFLVQSFDFLPEQTFDIFRTN